MMTGAPIYLIVGLMWLGAAIGWAIFAGRLGKRYAAESDGCLLGFANVVLTFVGGGVGFLLAPYPLALGTSLFGALILPGLVTGFFVVKNRP